MIIMEVTREQYFGKEDNKGQGLNIPAYLENGKLVIGHNGGSKRCFPYSSFDEYYAKDFEFFCNHKYGKAAEDTPCYIHKGIPFELMRVVSAGKKAICTFLTPCRVGTYFCKCKDCGRNFVIDCYETLFFCTRNLTIPTVRCKGCINKRKVMRLSTTGKRQKVRERLTDKAWKNFDPWECCGQDYFCQRGCHDEGGCANGCIVPKVYNRLASYEDIGVTLEEIIRLQMIAEAAKTLVEGAASLYDPNYKANSDVLKQALLAAGYEVSHITPNKK